MGSNGSKVPKSKAARRNEDLGDFSTTWRMLPISLLAMGIGVVCAYVAQALLQLIGLFTNLFHYGRWGTALVSPAGNHLGYWSMRVPRLLPVLGPDGTLSRIFTSGDLHQWLGQRDGIDAGKALWELARRNVVSAPPDEPLRAAVHRMAENGITRLPVVEAETRKFLGILSLDDLLKARSRHFEEERRREQVLRLPYLEGPRPVSADRVESK